jgi:hypothetical protein
MDIAQFIRRRIVGRWATFWKQERLHACAAAGQHLKAETTVREAPNLKSLLAQPRQMVSKATALIVLSFFAPLWAAFAQTDPGLSPRPSSPLPQMQQTSRRAISWKQLFPNVLKDEKEIWWEFPKKFGTWKALVTDVPGAGWNSRLNCSGSARRTLFSPDLFVSGLQSGHEFQRYNRCHGCCARNDLLRWTCNSQVIRQANSGVDGGEPHCRWRTGSRHEGHRPSCAPKRYPSLWKLFGFVVPQSPRPVLPRSWWFPLRPHFGGVLGGHDFCRTISHPSLGAVGRLHRRRGHRLLKDHEASTLSFRCVCRGSPRICDSSVCRPLPLGPTPALFSERARFSQIAAAGCGEITDTDSGKLLFGDRLYGCSRSLGC